VKSPTYYEPDLNPTYQELAEYYRVAVIPARVRRPKEKASVENGVQNVERWVLAPLRKRTFFSIAEANRAVKKQLEILNQREMKMVGKSRDQLFEELDQAALRPLPEKPYEFAIWKKVRVNIDYHVVFEKNYYSVPYPLIHEEVDLRVTERMVEIFHKGEQVAIHLRKRQAGQYSTRSEHMPSNHRFVAEVNTEHLLEWAARIGPQTKKWASALFQSRPYPEQAYRTCLGVLNLARKYGTEQTDRACQISLEAHLLSYRDVKAELDRQTRLLTPSQPTALPVHENIRGDTYYK
jgi:transposase